MKKQKPIIVIEVKIEGEIYNRVYSIEDFKNVIKLFNEIHNSPGSPPNMIVRIVEVKNRGRLKV